MKIGKLPENILERTVFKQLNVKRKEVLIGPGIGIDCSLIEFDPDELCVVSSDPITATVEDIGSLAVYITSNDLASAGAEPIGIMLTVLLPPNFSENNLKKIIQDVDKICKDFNIEVIGGHTEVTNAVNQPILSVTGIGKIKKKEIQNMKGPKVGQEIIMTKHIALEGTSIIAKAKEEELKNYYNHDFIDKAKTFNKYISIIPESKIAMEYEVSYMHDVTEGGIFGALWELSSINNVGIEVYLNKIPIRQETVEICEYYNLNPYKLISSGSLLITTNQGKELVEALKNKGIEANVIGKVTKGNKKLIIQPDSTRSLEPAKSDELYKIL